MERAVMVGPQRLITTPPYVARMFVPVVMPMPNSAEPSEASRMAKMLFALAVAKAGTLTSNWIWKFAGIFTCARMVPAEMVMAVVARVQPAEQS